MIAKQLQSVYSSIVAHEGAFKKDTDDSGLKFLFNSVPLLKQLRLKPKYYAEVRTVLFIGDRSSTFSKQLKLRRIPSWLILHKCAY